MPSPKAALQPHCGAFPVFQFQVSLIGYAYPKTIHHVLKHSCVLWRERGQHRDPSGVLFKGHNPSPSQNGRCHGGSHDSPLHGEGFFLPSRYAKPWNIKPAPQETRAVTKG